MSENLITKVHTADEARQLRQGNVVRMEYPVKKDLGQFKREISYAVVHSVNRHGNDFIDLLTPPVPGTNELPVVYSQHVDTIKYDEGLLILDRNQSVRMPYANKGAFETLGFTETLAKSDLLKK